MKTILTTLILLFLLVLNAQDRFFAHTATVGNIVTDATIIDNPLLNNNPSARLIVSHLYEDTYNNKMTGVYYNSTFGKWMIYNEDITSMTPNTKYFVYVADDAYSFQHDANTGNTLNYSTIDNPLLNGNPSKNVVLTHVFITERVNKNLGLFYSTPNWLIYDEQLTNVSVPSSYFVATDGAANVTGYRHQATVSNTFGNYTLIDFPLLNNNPNAKFVFTHNWGVVGDDTNVVLDKVLGAWYNGSKWAIYTEDISNMPEGAAFDLLIDANSMGVEELTSYNQTSVFPNPISNTVNFMSNNNIESITIYNMTGQEVLNQKVSGKNSELNVASFPSGVYVAKVKTDKGEETIKLIKK